MCLINRPNHANLCLNGWRTPIRDIDNTSFVIRYPHDIGGNKSQKLDYINVRVHKKLLRKEKND